ncbi:hypothetical protein OM076_30735 [Solirubrobacter ginsenosidimutans]|uniref:Right handed beta helix domain-containing protein n=1 Tax=Solirubrobacter ginsenosidimutans TaxID=490573 RepID=A0A9X3S3J1_9ACTN|nr:choice-of-anchor Q domain-containing protein [Solirubrobacter ginsenosidimutans]MDA0164684.1 hypothetical protein [Solirubrobacter ginsenosidimutans]
MTAKLALATVVLALFPAAASADTFTVTGPADTIGASGCTAALCTLRSAISAAADNGNTTDDVIVLPAGQYAVSTQLGQLAIPTGATRITIQGAGANSTTIQPPASIRTLTINSNASVTITGVTLRGGSGASGQGGNLLLSSQASATLDRVRITGGNAAQGGGVAALGATALTIQSSLIDANIATGTALTAAGGGVYVQGQTFTTALTVQDSTIVSNSARNGGGIAIENNSGKPPVLRGVTLTRNNARAGTPSGGAGGISSAATNATFQGSIVGGNTSTFNFGPGPQDLLSNCSLATPATDAGGNVTPDTADACGLGGSHADPHLAAALDSSEPPALALPANSPAVDIADCAGRTVDQRGVARPQLNACDAGAYEYQPPPVEPTPTPTPTETPAPSPTATPTPTPPPVRNESVGATPVRGTVLVKLPRTSKFVPLDASVIGNGSEVDTRKGRVEITTSTGEKAVFYEGTFKVSQSGGLTTLTLTEKLAPCPKAKSSARAAAKKPKTRKLWGDGKGKFRTKGQYSAATVRGTKWLVQDGCRYTRTTVASGVVSVRDDVTKRTIIRRKGTSYTARPRR